MLRKGDTVFGGWFKIEVPMFSSNEKIACKRKTRFTSDAAAQAALKKIKSGWFSKKPSRVYKCPVCSGWHLTSRPKR